MELHSPAQRTIRLDSGKEASVSVTSAPSVFTSVRFTLPGTLCSKTITGNNMPYLLIFYFSVHIFPVGLKMSCLCCLIYAVSFSCALLAGLAHLDFVFFVLLTSDDFVSVNSAAHVKMIIPDRY